MQEGTVRIILEPIARSTPGAEGVVDLYLMPAYDDVATLFYEDGWKLHYPFPERRSSPRSRRLRWTPNNGPLDRGVFVKAFPISTGPDSCQFDLGRGPVTRPLMGTLLVARPEAGPQPDSDFKLM